MAIRTTWRHIKENPGWAFAMWLVNFVIFAGLAALSAQFFDMFGGNPVSIGTLLWPLWMATVQTFVLTWWQMRTTSPHTRPVRQPSDTCTAWQATRWSPTSGSSSRSTPRHLSPKPKRSASPLATRGQRG